MGRRDMLEFLSRLRECDVQPGFAEPSSFEEKLQGQGRLAGARFAFDEVHAGAWQSTAQKFIESRDTGRCRLRELVGGWLHRRG
jgi:hypothetical protein